MKKRKLLALTLIFALVFTFCLTGCGGSAPEEEGTTEEESTENAATYELKIAHIGTTNDSGDTAFQYLKKILEERTNGQIKVTIFGDKALAGSDPELAEICKQGIVSLVPVPNHTLSALVDIPQLKIYEFPYLFKSKDDVHKLLDSELMQEWCAPLESVGLKVYGGFVKGWLSIGLKGTAPAGADDYANYKIRTMSTDMQMALIDCLGSSATVVAYGELYTAIQQGTVDGSLTATSLYLTDRFCEVVDSLSIIRATPHLHNPIVNKAWYDTLTPELQEIFDECMADYSAQARIIEDEFDQKAIKDLAEKEGVTVVQYTDEELEAFKEKMKPFWDKFYNEPGEGVLDEVLDFFGYEALNK
jgi:TRAP-type C4-dicarboxylate transport system substrate-binding protein